MEKLAIIGSGISGSPIAYYLQDQYEVDVYEKSSRVGGHAHTLDLDTESIISNYTQVFFLTLLSKFNYS